MKSYKKALVASLATIGVSSAIIGGATFALFTSDSTTNIAVTSGKVNVVATAELTEVWSAEWNGSEYARNVLYQPEEEATTLADGTYNFTNGGTAKLTDGVVSLSDITPGDGVQVQVNLTNNSTVAIKYKVSVGSANDNGLYEGLEVSYYANAEGTQEVSTGWSEAVTGDIAPIYVNIELPILEEEQNKYQDKKCDVVITVEAVQGNAMVSDLSISSADELKAFAEAVNKGNDYDGSLVELTQDFTVEDWTPIGNGMRTGSSYTGQAFKGTFNGNGHTVTINSVATTSNKDEVNGIFGIIDGGKVSDLNVVANIAATSEQVGAVAGILANGGTIDKVTVSGTIQGTEATAGVVGRILANGTVTNCTNNATVIASAHNAGGIVGAAYYTNKGEYMTISGCENNGEVTGTYAVGGVVGLSAANVSDCVNNGVVTASGSSVGGVVGEQQNYGTVAGCINNADVNNESSSSKAYGTGGVVGWIRYSGAEASYQQKEVITVSGNVNYGSIKGVVDAGGIVGTLYNGGIVENNKNYAASLSANTFAAGIVGNVQVIEATPGLSDEATPNLGITISYNTTTTAISNITVSGICKDLYFYSNNNAIKNAEGNGFGNASTVEEVTYPADITKQDFIDNNAVAVNDNGEYIANTKQGIQDAIKAGGTLYFQEGAKVPLMDAHVNVTKDLTIYANGADFGGKDISIGTYAAPEQTETTIKVYSARNLTVWGQPTDKRADVWNVYLEDCVNTGYGFLMYRAAEDQVATINFTAVNCTATGYTDSIIHTTADGSITLTDCTFINNCAPVNIAHKQSGAMTVVVENCVFNGCGKINPSDDYFAPARFVNNAATAGEMLVTLKNNTFVNTIGTNGDILLGDYRKDTQYKLTAVIETSTSVMVKSSADAPYSYNGGTIVIGD